MGSYIHAIDKELKTPLMYAAENNHLSIVKYLMKCKANIKQRVRKLNLLIACNIDENQTCKS